MRVENENIGALPGLGELDERGEEGGAVRGEVLPRGDVPRFGISNIIKSRSIRSSVCPFVCSCSEK